MLQVIPKMESGGAERTTLDVARALVAAGHTAVVATAGGRLVADLERAGADVQKLPVDSKSPWQIWRNVKRLDTLIRSRAIGVVHARSRASAWSAFHAARSCGVPFVTTYHGTYGDRLGPKRHYNAIMTRGDKVIANSAFIGRLLKETYDLPEDRIEVIPRGLDPDEFAPERVTPERVAALRKAWNVNAEGRAVVLLPARLTRWKGHLVLLDAIGLLHAEGRRDFVCVFLGEAKRDGSFERQIRSRVAELYLSEDVIMPGYCHDMPAAYALSDVVVSPATRPEAFGRVAIEAQAMGKPVIVSDHGGARETVVEGMTGWRVPPGEAGSLARALDAALDLPPESRGALARRARSHVVEAYSVAQMCDKTIALYEALACRRGAGRAAAD